MVEQSYLTPDLFQSERQGEPRFWLCIRTKPRWEKKFAAWLKARGIPYYLPVVIRRQMRYRKEQVTELPLIPGYVFIAADKDRGDLRESCSVIYIIRPDIRQMPELHTQIWNIWKGLTAGSHLELTQDLKVGQLVEVVAGPLKGIRGRFQRWGTGGRLVLDLDVLGVGAALEIPDGSVTVAV